MPIKFIRLPAVMELTGLARSTIYLRIKQGAFPKPVPLGSAHVVGWVEEEVYQWCDKQFEAHIARGKAAAFCTGIISERLRAAGLDGHLSPQELIAAGDDYLERMA